ncbi:MAG: FAD/NAD(P)-binding protein [Methylovirgula sp.]
MTSVAIIGGGFSGTILAINLMSQGSAQDHLILIEKRAEIGVGQAYSTHDPNHLLNIPAVGMSPIADVPTAFADFLDKHRDLLAADGIPPDSDVREVYASRALFGRFVKTLVDRHLKAAPGRPQLTIVQGTAMELRHGDRGDTKEIILADGRTFQADRIVLAAGNLPPRLPNALDGLEALSENYVADPWAAGAVETLDPKARIFLLGTGLTMVDYAQSLGARDHKGEIIALSRHGLLPRRQEPVTQWPPFIDLSVGLSLRKLLRRVREQIALAAHQGENWQSVLNSLRSFSQPIWTGFSEADQARFIRHIRPFWDVHRHRIAPAVADRLTEMIAAKQLRVIAGHVTGFRRADNGILLDIRPRGGDRSFSVEADKLINCSGPNYDFSTSDEILLKRLLAQGRITLDRHKLGVRVGTHFGTVDQSGVEADDLFAMGPMLRGQYWEINAVREIVAQAETMARPLWSSPQEQQVRRTAQG